MKRTALAAVLAVIVSGCSGCMSSGKLVRELARDNASVSVDVMTPYGSARLRRANPPPGGSATITPDGTLTVQGAVPAVYATNLPPAKKTSGSK